MPARRSVALIGALTVAGMTGGCSGADRPTIRSDASQPTSCEAAVAAAFPDGNLGTLVAYREVIRRCSSLAELARREAVQASILRLDCAPADVLALGGEIPQLRRDVPSAPADLISTPVCEQFNRECTDYDELRRDHIELARNPTVANRGLYVHDRRLFEACTQRYG